MQRRLVKGYTEDEDIRIPIIEFVNVSSKYIKFYDSIESKLILLNRIDISLLFYLAKTQTNDMVYSHKLTRAAFKNHVLKMTNNKVDYTDGSIVQAFHHLKKESLLLSIKGTLGAYILNPMFIYTGLENERKRLLNTIDVEEFEKENEIRYGKKDKIT